MQLGSSPRACITGGAWHSTDSEMGARTGDPLQLLDRLSLPANDAAHNALGRCHHVRLADALLQGAAEHNFEL